MNCNANANFSIPNKPSSVLYYTIPFYFSKQNNSAHLSIMFMFPKTAFKLAIIRRRISVAKLQQLLGRMETQSSN